MFKQKSIKILQKQIIIMKKIILNAMAIFCVLSTSAQVKSESEFQSSQFSNNTYLKGTSKN